MKSEVRYKLQAPKILHTRYLNLVHGLMRRGTGRVFPDRTRKWRKQWKHTGLLWHTRALNTRSHLAWRLAFRADASPFATTLLSRFRRRSGLERSLDEFGLASDAVDDTGSNRWAVRGECRIRVQMVLADRIVLNVAIGAGGRETKAFGVGMVELEVVLTIPDVVAAEIVNLLAEAHVLVEDEFAQTI